MKYSLASSHFPFLNPRYSSQHCVVFCCIERTVSTQNRKKLYSYIFLKRPLERPRLKCEDNIEMDLQEVGCGGCGLDRFGSG